ncbi:MAG: hypothetical protein ABUK01_06485 [Leptospirales bacterium]
MSGETRDKLIDQLRSKYERAAEKYGKKFFDLVQLESRITHMMQTGLNVQSFLEQEMEFYMKTESLAEVKLSDQKKRDEFNQRAEAMMAANDALLDKYKDIFFDPAASHEIRRLVGAITEWVKYYYPVIEYLLRGTSSWETINQLTGELERFNVPDEFSPTVLLRHYVEELKELGPNQREKVERKLLQTAALALYRLENIIIDEKKLLQDFDNERVMRFPGYEEDIKDRWHEKKQNVALEEAFQFTRQIVDDFRLRDLAKHADQLKELNTTSDFP